MLCCQSWFVKVYKISLDIEYIAGGWLYLYIRQSMQLSLGMITAPKAYPISRLKYWLWVFSLEFIRQSDFEYISPYSFPYAAFQSLESDSDLRLLCLESISPYFGVTYESMSLPLQPPRNEVGRRKDITLHEAFHILLPVAVIDWLMGNRWGSISSYDTSHWNGNFSVWQVLSSLWIPSQDSFPEDLMSVSDHQYNCSITNGQIISLMRPYPWISSCISRR